MQERQIERKMCQAAAKLGCAALKFVSPGKSGVPDRIVLCPGGRTVFIELKRPGGKPRLLQMYAIHRLRELGFPCFVVSTTEEVEACARQIEHMMREWEEKS